MSPQEQQGVPYVLVVSASGEKIAVAGLDPHALVAALDSIAPVDPGR